MRPVRRIRLRSAHTRACATRASTAPAIAPHRLPPVRTTLLDGVVVLLGLALAGLVFTTHRGEIGGVSVTPDLLLPPVLYLAVRFGVRGDVPGFRARGEPHAFDVLKAAVLVVIASRGCVMFSCTRGASPSAQRTFSSGVLKLVGKAFSTALGFLLRDRISSSRAAV